MTKTVNTKQQVRLPKEVLVKAQARAHALGLTLTEYVQTLVNQDVQMKEYDPWLQPISPAVNEKWQRDIAEFDEQEQIKPRPSVRTAEELIKRLDDEASRLPDDEGN